MNKITLVLGCLICALSGFAQEANNSDSLAVSVTPQLKVDSLQIQKDTLSYSEKRLMYISENLAHLCEHQEYYNKPRYQLFPTPNTWTFIKLDTRKGHLTHVQFSVEGNQMEYSLGSPYSYFSEIYDSLIENGRFTLYPTQNTYNLILLDQINGDTWQVQWNREREKRLVIPIN